MHKGGIVSGDESLKIDIQIDIRDAIELLRKYGINAGDILTAKDEHDVIHLSAKVGYPSAMKVISKDVIHKTDSGCVVLDIRDERDAIYAFTQIKENTEKIKIEDLTQVIDKKKKGKEKKGAKRDDLDKTYRSAAFEGVSIQRMHSGTEIIVGMKRDPQFGPVVMFGLGGIFVEVMKDVSMGVAPIDTKYALEMIESTKASMLLKGFRGSKPADINKIADIIVKVSKLAMKEKDIMEIDLNPIMVDGGDINIVDIRIIAKASGSRKG